jgi:hypothetical protein
VFIRSAAFASSLLLFLGTSDSIRESFEGTPFDRRSSLCPGLSEPQHYSVCVARAARVPGRFRPAQLASSPGTLELHNRLFEHVRVEISVGASQNCDENDIQGPAVLAQNENWAVVSTQLVCWRREQVPGDSSSGWTAWVQVQLAADEVRDVTL